MADLELCQLSKSFNGKDVLTNVSLTLAHGKRLVLLGRSGSGKSTALRLIAGLETPDSGDILLGDRSIVGVVPRKRGISMVFQDFSVYPAMTTRENIAFPLKAQRMTKHEIDQRVTSIARTLDLHECLQQRAETLSGGEQQRLAFARAVVRQSDLLLMDEPMSNIDAPLRESMRLELIRLQRQLDMTIVYVTHDQTEAMLIGDLIAILDSGKLVQVGSPTEIYHRPRNRFVAQFVGSPAMNVIEDSSGDCIGIRPEEISLERNSADDLSFSVVIRSVQDVGSHRLIGVQRSQQWMTISTRDRRELQIDQSIDCFVKQISLHRFDRSSGERV
ncbi:MAG: ABC transporter ATP-binding protein [Pirellulaceae bacterium]